MSKPRSPRLTLARLLTLPILAAVAMACFVMAEGSGAVRAYGISQVILIEAILLPLAGAMIALVVARRGRGRERLVAVCLIASATAGTVVLLVMGAANLWDIGAEVVAGRGMPIDLLGITMAMAGGLIWLIAMGRALLPRAIPARCPNCGNRALFPVRGETTGPGRRSGMPMACDACGATARRRDDGTFSIERIDHDGATSWHPSTVA